MVELVAMSGKLEQRRLQSVANNSFSITLPKWWIKKYNLTKGSSILLQEDKGFLKLFPSNRVEGRVTLNLDEFDSLDYVKYLVRTYYIQGVEAATITSSHPMKPDEKKELRKLREELAGAEIVDEAPESITINFTHIMEDQPLEASLKSIADFMATIVRDATRALLEGEEDIAIEVEGRMEEIGRHYRWLMRRIVLTAIKPSLKNEYNFRDLISFVLAARDLYAAIRHLTYYVRYVRSSHLAGEDLDEVKDLSGKLIQLIREAVEAFTTKNMGKVFWVLRFSREVRRQQEVFLQKLFSRHEDKEALILAMIVQELRRITSYCVGLVDAAANRVAITSLP
ncbi:MAG: hypothetical protein DRO52_05980 [Candidatus Hecatellales archaeon]|nr:MAG: hypothetical protein DRO52_05980 [Candidatus Hecatellales archaeon]